MSPICMSSSFFAAGLGVRISYHEDVSNPDAGLPMWTKPMTVPGTVIDHVHVVALPEVEMALVGDCCVCVLGSQVNVRA